MARLILGRAVFIANAVDFTEHARSGVVRPAVRRHRQEFLAKLGRGGGKHLESAAPVFRWYMLRHGSLNGLP